MIDGRNKWRTIWLNNIYDIQDKHYSIDLLPESISIYDSMERKDIQKETLKLIMKVNSKFDKELQEREVESTNGGGGGGGDLYE